MKKTGSIEKFVSSLDQKQLTEKHQITLAVISEDLFGSSGTINNLCTNSGNTCNAHYSLNQKCTNSTANACANSENMITCQNRIILPVAK